MLGIQRIQHLHNDFRQYGSDGSTIRAEFRGWQLCTHPDHGSIQPFRRLEHEGTDFPCNIPFHFFFLIDGCVES